jgi:hypothetical protein
VQEAGRVQSLERAELSCRASERSAGSGSAPSPRAPRAASAPARRHHQVAPALVLPARQDVHQTGMA